MAESSRLRWPYPSQYVDPWYEPFQALVEAMDASVYTTREDRSSVLMSAATVYRPGAAPAALLGAVTVVHQRESNSAWDADVVVSGNNAIPRCGSRVSWRRRSSGAASLRSLKLPALCKRLRG